MTGEPHASPFAPEDAQQSSSLPAFWVLAWRHKLLLGLGLVVGLAGAALYCSQLVPEYQSMAKVLIVKKRVEVPLSSDTRTMYLDEILNTHQQVIRSPMIVDDAVRKGDLKKLASFKSRVDPAGDIIRGLNVTIEGSGFSQIFTISYRSTAQDDCNVILDAVADSYMDFLDDKYRSVSRETVKLINKAQEYLQNGLRKSEQDFLEFQLGSTNDGTLLFKNKEGVSLWQEKLISLDQQRAAFKLRHREIEARLAAYENAQKAGASAAELEAMVVEAMSKEARDAAAKNTEETLQGLRMQEMLLSEDFGPDHPQVRALRKRMEVIRAFAKSPQRFELRMAPADYFDALRRELEQGKTKEKVLLKQLDEDKVAAKRMIELEMQEDKFRKEIGRQRALLDNVMTSLQNINLQTDLGGIDASKIAPATFGSRVFQKSVPMYFLIGSILGLLGGLGLAVMAELSDHSFRSPEDVRRRLGLPIMGQIPDLDREEELKAGLTSSPLAPILCAVHRPKSREAEAYRGVRTGLFFSTQGKGHTVIQITSPSMGDGKSTLAANLAVSIAQADKKVVLIDADFRRPTLHKLFGLNPTRGLSAVINGEAELADIVMQTAVPGLSVLPCGPTPHNPAELLSSPRIKEMLDYLREQYDFVIVDTPPLLAVTDPCMIVPLVDGVILTMRIRKQNRPAAQRAKEILATLDAHVMGVVVNAVDGANSGSYTYGYGYGFGYGYGYGQNGEYYREKSGDDAAKKPEPEKASA